MDKPEAIVEHDHHHHANDRRKSVDRKTFSLETYLGFLLTRDRRNLSVDHINKIVSIHGFKKGSVRKIAEETLNLITNPIHPARSTLKDDIPSSKSVQPIVTLTEVVKDLKLLNWQECSITSVKTISSEKYTDPTDIPAATPDEVSLSEAAAKLMSLRGSKRHRTPSPTPLATDATSLMSSGSVPNENSFGSGGCMSSSKVSGSDARVSPTNGRIDCVSPSIGPSGRVSSSKLLGDFVLPSIIPDVGVKKRKTGIKRVYLKNLYGNDDAQTSMASRSQHKN
ncbi:hypothetical protein vseg_018233 [Gypsophila vaccaria]